jgi:acyl transferase domain-containing protein
VLAQPASARGSVYVVTGDNVSVAAGRVSFSLGLQGPCSSVDTAHRTHLLGYSGPIPHAVLRHTRNALHALTPATPFGQQWRTFRWSERSHPFVQQHLTSSRECNVYCSPVAGSLHALVANHVVQGRVIFPGAGYLEMARAGMAAGTALHTVFFLLPLAVEKAGLLIECAVDDSSVEVRSRECDGVLADASVHWSGTVGTRHERQRVSRVSMRAGTCTCIAHVGSLYEGFWSGGLEYGPGYRTLTQAWRGSSSALARLQTRVAHEGTVVHPADLDDALCISALIGSNGGDGETRLPFAMDDVLLHGASGGLWAVRYFSAP